METRRLIFASTLFSTGTISATLLLNNNKVDDISGLFVLLIVIAILGFILMLANIVEIDKLKGLFKSRYDITGKQKWCKR